VSDPSASIGCMAAPPFVPDASQARVLEHGAGALLVSGGPGSGKTAVLRERFARLVEAGADPERVVLFTLSRRAAREARDRLMARLRRSVPELPAWSFHQYAYRELSARYAELAYEAPPRVLAAPEQYAEVRGLLLDQRPQDWPTFGDLLEVPAFGRQVADFVLRCQERLLSPEDLDALVRRTGRDDLGELAVFYRRYLDALGANGQIDFGGLLQQASRLLELGSPGVAGFRHVLVDDFQDVTVAGEAIVGALGRGADSVVVAADPGGHVFSFRGGSLEPLARLDRTLPGLRRDRLGTNHRLGERAGVLHALDPPAADGRLAPAGDGGSAPGAPEFDARVFAHPGEEVEAVAHELLRLRVDDDVAWSSMAVVLRRYGPYLTALRHALSRHGIPFVVVAETAALATEPAVRPVIDLLRYVFQPLRRDQLLEPLLASPLVGLDPYGLRSLRREAHRQDRPLRSLVEDEAAELPPAERPAVERLRTLVRTLPALAADRGPDAVFFEIWKGWMPNAESLVASAPTSPAAGRHLDALSGFAATLGRFTERRPGATIEDYLETLDAAEFGPDPWLPPEERQPNAVRVTSAHRAHGMEFEAVVVAGCVEGEFPSLAHGSPLVSLEPLLEVTAAEAGGSPASRRIARRLAEERALFRLVVSRARRRTVLFASTSSGSRTARSPSRFAARLGLAWDDRPREVPASTSLRSVEAELRRRLADRAEVPAHRLAAAASMAEVGADPAAWWGRFDWSEPGLPLHEGEIWTSYSHLSSLENCGLQYLYQEELGLDPSSSHQMWVGSLVHGLIDRVQRGELPRDLDTLRGEVEAGWRTEVFPNRAIEHRRKLDVVAMLDRWMRGEHEEAVRSEEWFEYPLDGAVIRGRIDAIFPMQNGHVRVVDYKTGRWVPTQKQVDENLQLASYYLAVKRAPQLADLPEPGYLQLAYLGAGREQTAFAAPGTSPKKREDYETWAEGRLLELIGRIRAEVFAPDPEADCQFCPFQTICPRWPQGGEAPVTAPVGGGVR
jgi:superfamily I DNA/RNA helicase/RecB family exonuclease